MAPPREFDFALDALGLEPAAGGLDELGGDALAGEVLGGLHGRGFRHAEDPAGLLGGGAAVDQLADLDDVGVVLLDPVLAGEAAVEEAILDVAGHFLGADEATVEGGVVERGAVGAAALGHGEPGPGEQLEGGLLEAAFGQSEHQFGGFLTHESLEEAHRPPLSKH